MNTCQRDQEGYRLTEHQSECRDRTCPGCVECTHDDAGNPVRHCGGRWKCTTHLSDDEHVCPRCLAMIRRNLTAILDAIAAMPPEVEEAGLNSSALSHAVPSAHPDNYRRRMILNRDDGHDDGEDYDQTDPWQMLGLRERMIREDLGHDDHILTSDTLAETCAYLGWVLTDLARDEQQTIIVGDLLTETSRIKGHLEGVLHDSRAAERGAPCPRCSSPAPRLKKRWAHYCTREECEREHDTSGARDTWQCPSSEEHWWSEADYRLWVSDDYLANASRLTAEQMEAQHGIKAGTVRVWASRDLVRKRGKDQRGRTLYDVPDTLKKHRSAESSCA